MQTSIKRGICRAKTTGRKWDPEMGAVTSHKILDADWLKKRVEECPYLGITRQSKNLREVL